MLYLYGVVAADAPRPDGLRGVEDGPVRLLLAGPVAGIVGEVPDDAFTEAALEANLADVGWVGPRAAEHERVLTWFADRGAVVPLALFSLHRDEARVRARLEADADRLTALLARLGGRREWLVRLWQGADAADDAVDAASPALLALAREIADATPGRRFLLEKKRQSLRTEERRRIHREVAGGAFQALAAHAEDAVSLPPPADAAGVAGARRGVLHAAFLVADAAFPPFRAAVEAAEGEAARAGLQLEFTGPWPPYHFARSDAR
jgi:hypothetical protein